MSFLVLLGGSFSQVWAKSDSVLLAASDYYSELPLVFSASRLQQPVSDSPVAVTVIDRDMIDSSGARSIADVLRLVPGMMVGHQADYYPIVSYHGLSSRYSRRMQVLVDGRSVYEPSFGGVKWAALPLSLEDVERIEVIRGPNAAAYGANAFLGVISITTRSAVLDEGGAINAQKGNRGFGSATVRYGAQAGETDFRVTAEKQLSDGVDELDDDSDRGVVSVRLDSGVTAADLLSLELGFANVDIEQPGSSFTSAHFVDSASDYIQARWRHKLAGEGELSIQAFRNTYLEKEYWQGGGILYDRHAFKVREEIEAQHSMTLAGRHRLVWGGGVRRDGINDAATFYTSQRQYLHMRRLFAHGEFRLTQKLLMNAGAMVEDQTLVGSKTSPRVALNYFVTPRQSLRLSVSRAYRNPVMFEEQADLRFVSPGGVTLFQLFESDGNIEPEVIDAYELGYVVALPAMQGSFDVKLYQDDMDKLVRSFFDSGKGVFNFRNGDRAKVRGVEMQMDGRINEHMRLFGNYAYATVDSEDKDGDYTHSVPRHKVSLLLNYQADNGLRSGVVYHYVDEMTWLGTNDPLDAYDRLDLNLARQFTLSGWSAEWQVALQNLSGDYADFDNDTIFEPRLYFSLTLSQ